MTTPNNTVAGLAEKWRKKPVVIEAVQYAHGMEDGFVVDGRYYDKSGPVPRAMHRKPAIKTLEGHHEISAGDWIITGVQGERYPCKPDIFAATYEPADALASPAPSATVVVEDTRVKFERWVSKRHGCGTERWADSGKYRYENTNEWWECWCAALAGKEGE